MQPITSVAFDVLVWVFVFGSAGIWLAIIRRLQRRQPVAAYEPHGAVPWSGWDVIFLVCLALALESAALGGSMPEGEVPEDLSVASLMKAGAAHLVWLAFAVGFLLMKVGARLEDVGFHVTKLRGDLRLGGMAFLAVLLPVYGLQLLLTQLMSSEHPLAKLAKEQPSTDVLALATVSAVVVAPLFEEFLFRVVLQGWFEKWEIAWREGEAVTGPVRAGWMPNVVVSAIFGLSHWGYGPDPAALFLLSIFLGYTYQQTHRIIAPMVVHVCFNALAVLQLWVMLT